MCLYSDESRGSDLSPGGLEGLLSGIPERRGQRELSRSIRPQHSEWNSNRHRTQVLLGPVSASNSILLRGVSYQPRLRPRCPWDLTGTCPPGRISSFPSICYKTVSAMRAGAQHSAWEAMMLSAC